jgi:uncharacterized membrane protein
VEEIQINFLADCNGPGGCRKFFSYYRKSGTCRRYLSRRRVEGIVEDERIRQVSRKASWATLQFTAIGFALGGAILIVMRDTYPGYTDLGFFMAYSGCAVLVLYSIFYAYFNMESGG